MCQFAAAVLCQKRSENHNYGITAPFLVYIINFYLKKRKIAVIPKQFNVSKVKLFFVCILVWRNYR